VTAAASQVSSDVTESTNPHHHQHHCRPTPKIIITCSPDSSDNDRDNDNNNDNIDNDNDSCVTAVEQVSCVFDQLLTQHAANHRHAPTLDDVIGDVTRLRRDVTEGADSAGGGGRAAAVSQESLAAECRRLVVDCKQLVSSVFYCSTADMTQYAERALNSLSALVRHSHDVIPGRAPAQLVCNVRRVVGAFEATVTAAKHAVGSPAAGVAELAGFIKQASKLARCLQLLLSNIVDVETSKWRTDETCNPGIPFGIRLTFGRSFGIRKWHILCTGPSRKVYPNCREWQWLSKCKFPATARSTCSTLALVKYFIHQTAKNFLSFNTRKKYNSS